MSRRMNVGGPAEKRQVVVINKPFVFPSAMVSGVPSRGGMITPNEAAALCGVGARPV